MENLVLRPLGKALEQAGLISDVQIRTALEIQSQANQLKFGKILVSQGIVKQKTVDFFADKLPELIQRPRTEPIGHYLKQASLINQEQIETILEEQKKKKLLFGELIIEKGWLRKRTIEFFLKCLEKTIDKQSIFSSSEKEIIRNLQLDSLVESPEALLKEVFSWTGGHPFLTREICRIISEHKHFVPKGLESALVKEIIANNVIYNWEYQELGGYLKTIQYYLLNNKACNPQQLLKLYLKILKQEKFEISKKEQQELINLGLVVQENNQIKISNKLYRSIFNIDWVENQLSKQVKKTTSISNHKSNKKNKIATNNQQIVLANKPKDLTNNQQIVLAPKLKNEPLAQITAFAIALGLLLVTPLVILFNNSQHKIIKENNSQNHINPQFNAQSNLCNTVITNDVTSQETLRLSLEQEQQKFPEQFPTICQNKLDQLIVLNALQLGKENRVLDAINNLCQVQPNSKSFNQANFWLSRWSKSDTWGEQTKSYLNSIDNCPAAKSNNLSQLTDFSVVSTIGN